MDKDGGKKDGRGTGILHGLNGRERMGTDFLRDGGREFHTEAGAEL